MWMYNSSCRRAVHHAVVMMCDSVMMASVVTRVQVQAVAAYAVLVMAIVVRAGAAVVVAVVTAAVVTVAVDAVTDVCTRGRGSDPHGRATASLRGDSLNRASYHGRAARSKVARDAGQTAGMMSSIEAGIRGDGGLVR